MLVTLHYFFIVLYFFCVWFVFGVILVAGGRVAGVAPQWRFSKSYPGSNLAPPLAEAGTINASAYRHLKGENGLATAFVLGGLFCFEGGSTEGETTTWETTMRSPRLARKRSGGHIKAAMFLLPIARRQASLCSPEIINEENIGLQFVEKPTLERKSVRRPMLDQAADPEKVDDSEEDLCCGGSSLRRQLPVGDPHTSWRILWRIAFCGRHATLP